MFCTRKVNDQVIWVGASDRRLAKFENLFPVPRGVSYNSYLILDDKTALMDTVDADVADRFLENVAATLDARALDYIVVQHMEPDHAATLARVLERYPDAQVVCNAKTLDMIGRFFPSLQLRSPMIVKDGDTLALGERTLQFVFAPMVHWPEVMVSYERKDKILFSADAFGSFGAIDGALFDDEADFDMEWKDDARRYYVNIVGKYGAPVQTLLKKAAGLDIRTICPLHGLVWRKDLAKIVELYRKWSSYEQEERGVLIAYASMYGNTQNLAELLACRLADRGVRALRVCDISVTDMSELTAHAFRYSHMILLSPTYNGELYPQMETFLSDLRRLALRARTVALCDNGAWAATAAKQMRTQLETFKDFRILDAQIGICSALRADDLSAVQALVDQIVESME